MGVCWESVCGWAGGEGLKVTVGVDGWGWQNWGRMMG